MPRLLDLFCGAGGAGAGYARAGFDVVGVDIKLQPRYPFEFWNHDAIWFLEKIIRDNLRWYDAIHASPPCQSFSKAVKKANRGKHPDLVAETRRLLKATGLPYIIENVPGAPLENPIQLCGSSFGLKVQRHRLFETSFFLMAPPCAHGINPRQFPPAWNRTTKLRVLSISGGYQKRQLSEDFMDQHKAAMGIDWEIQYDELSNAIPPAYTQFIGEALLEHISRLEHIGRVSRSATSSTAAEVDD